MALTIRKFITNRADNLSTSREVVLLQHSINMEAEIITMYTRVLYYDSNNIDITSKFQKNEPILTATNIKKQTLYENDGITPQQQQQVIDGIPQFEEDGVTPIMVNKTIGLYDYLISLISKTVVLETLYEQYIDINDAKGNFNIAER
jgi:hypothetical protein